MRRWTGSRAGRRVALAAALLVALAAPTAAIQVADPPFRTTVPATGHQAPTDRTGALGAPAARPDEPVAVRCGTAADRLACEGANPFRTGCSADATVAAAATFRPAHMRIYYSPTCQAAWAVLAAPTGYRAQIELDAAGGFRTCNPADCQPTAPITTTSCHLLPGRTGCLWTNMIHHVATVDSIATALATWHDPTGHVGHRFVALTGEDLPGGG